MHRLHRLVNITTHILQQRLILSEDNEDPELIDRMSRLIKTFAACMYNKWPFHILRRN